MASEIKLVAAPHEYLLIIIRLLNNAPFCIPIRALHCYTLHLLVILFVDDIV